MRNFIMVALFAVTASGCGNIKDAKVDLYTNEKGQLSRAVIVQSSGDKDMDNLVLRRSKQNFQKVVSNPRKNVVYHQPVKVHLEPEPLFK